MNCPKCGFEMSGVVDSRYINNTKRRRRECILCGERYTTVEVFYEDFKKMQKDKNVLEQKIEKIKSICLGDQENE